MKGGKNRRVAGGFFIENRNIHQFFPEKCEKSASTSMMSPYLLQVFSSDFISNVGAHHLTAQDTRMLEYIRIRFQRHVTSHLLLLVDNQHFNWVFNTE